MFRVVALISLLVSFTINADQSCPPSFQSFLSDFQNNHEFQGAHILYPLTYSYLDANADPEPKTIKISLLSENDVKSRKPPSYPTPIEMQSIPLEQKITNTTAGNYIVTFNKPDTDYSFEYIFLTENNCWQLSEINDFSL